MSKLLSVFLVVVALSAATLSSIGVFARDATTSTTIIVTSVRGEIYPMTARGVYAFNAQRVVVEGIGWDIFTLFAVVPALLVCAAHLYLRSSFRSRVVAVGLLAYLFYQYLMYAVTWAFGPLFLGFVVLYALSCWGIVWLAPSLITGAAHADRFDEDRFPRRSIAILSAIVALVLTGMWLHRVVIGLRGDLSGAMLLGQTTMVIPALDLGLIVPLAVFTAVMAWRRRVVGYVLASVFTVKAIAMALAICAMLISAWRINASSESSLELVPPLLFFGTVAAASIVIGIKMFRATSPLEESGCKSCVAGQIPRLTMRET